MSDVSPLILLVDDEESILSLAEMTLEEEGFRVLKALSGQQALDFADQHRSEIGLFMIDIVMPGMSGPDLALRLSEMCPRTPVMFTSGYGEGAALALKRSGSGAFYLKKPFSPDELAEAAHRLLAD